MSIQTSASLNLRIPSGPTTFSANWFLSAEAHDRSNSHHPQRTSGRKAGNHSGAVLGGQGVDWCCICRPRLVWTTKLLEHALSASQKLEQQPAT
jgi:hypothetical protein